VSLGFCKNCFHQNSISECLCNSLSPYSAVGVSFVVKCEMNIMILLMLFRCVYKAVAKSDKIWSRGSVSWCGLYFASKNSATFS
jgi:hypothetical protein